MEQAKSYDSAVPTIQRVKRDIKADDIDSQSKSTGGGFLGSMNGQLAEPHHCGLLGVTCDRRTFGLFAAFSYITAGLVFYWIINWGPSDPAGAGLRQSSRPKQHSQVLLSSMLGPCDAVDGCNSSTTGDVSGVKTNLRGIRYSN